jgi:N-acetylglutamate synthase-like GNAT family acetyltransferase
MVYTRQQRKRTLSQIQSPNKRARIADPKTGQYTTHIFTDFEEFQGALDLHLNRTKTQTRSDQVRKLILEQCQSDISKNFITNTANTRVNNKFWVLATKPDRGGLAGFASATLYQDAISGMPTVYLDLVCSNSGRGTSLVNTVMAVGQAAGAKLARLSALPQVVGYYQKKFGFTRVPNACMSMQSAYPKVRHNNNNVHPNFGPLYMHPKTEGNYNGENYGYVMSKCLPRADWKLRQRFRNLGLTFGAQWKNQNGRSPNRIVGENKASLTNANVLHISKNLFNADNPALRLFPTQTDANMKAWWNTGMQRYQKKR